MRGLKKVILGSGLLIMALILVSCTTTNNGGNNMEIKSSGITNGVIDDKYGKRGNQFTENGMPNYSIPIEIINSPEGTKAYAIFIEDKDAIPVTGFPWIHWTAANIKTTSIEENASLNDKGKFVQGRNSWSGQLNGEGALSALEASMYGGMAPPDKEHTYDIYVYALSEELDLEEGFYANEMFKAMEGKILGQAKIQGSYKN